MNAQDPFEGQSDTPRKAVFDDEGVERGSAWAALDESFFGIVEDLFTPTYRLGAEILLSSNDNAVSRRFFIPEQPAEYEPAAADDDHNDDDVAVTELDDEARAEARRAAMRRHPSSWRRLH